MNFTSEQWNTFVGTGVASAAGALIVFIIQLINEKRKIIHRRDHTVYTISATLKYIENIIDNQVDLNDGKVHPKDSANRLTLGYFSYTQFGTLDVAEEAYSLLNDNRDIFLSPNCYRYTWSFLANYRSNMRSLKDRFEHQNIYGNYGMDEAREGYRELTLDTYNSLKSLLEKAIKEMGVYNKNII